MAAESLQGSERRAKQNHGLYTNPIHTRRPYSILWSHANKRCFGSQVSCGLISGLVLLSIIFSISFSFRLVVLRISIKLLLKSAKLKEWTLDFYCQNRSNIFLDPVQRVSSPDYMCWPPSAHIYGVWKNNRYFFNCNHCNLERSEI